MRPPAQDGGSVPAEGQNREGDEGLGGFEPEHQPGEQADVGVGGLDEPLAQAVLESAVDRLAVLDDATLQADERRDATAAGPADPPVEAFLAGL